MSVDKQITYRGMLRHFAVLGVCTSVFVLGLGSGCSSFDEKAYLEDLLGTALDDGLDADLVVDEVSPARSAKRPAGTTTGATVSRPDTPLAELVPSGRRRAQVTVQPESEVKITVSEDSNLNGIYAVSDFGAIQFKYVGLVVLNNMSVDQAAAYISRRLEQALFETATVKVEIMKASFDRVAVYGSVNEPGEVKIGAGAQISLHDVLLRAKGLQTSIRSIKIKIVPGGLADPRLQNKPGTVHSLGEGDEMVIPKVMLQNNDLVYVFPAHRVARPQEAGALKEIMVLGEVSRPGVVSFPPEEACTIMYLYFKTGLPKWADYRRIEIRRKTETGNIKKIIVNLEEILEETGKRELDIPLKDGDTIYVPARKVRLW